MALFPWELSIEDGELSAWLRGRLTVDGALDVKGDLTASGALNITGTIQGDLLNNYMISKAGFDVLGLMSDPRFLNLMCEDPGTGTMVDISGQGHNGTYNGAMTTSDRVKAGMGWLINFDNSNDYIAIADNDDLSFGDGSNDEAVTFFGVLQVAASAGLEPVISKWHSGATLREYRIDIDADEKLIISFFDESVDKLITRITDAALSDGWHTYVITYDGAGGATAANTIKIYVDGALVASTASNDASYVAMENLAIGVRIASGNDSLFYNGDIACTGMDGSELSAFDAHRFHQLMKGVYGL